MTTHNPARAPATTQDDRILAALAHVAVLLPMVGVIAPIVIWVTQRGQSAYVRFQALQAAAYQLSLILLWFVGMAGYMCSFFALFLVIPLSIRASDSASVPLFFPAGFGLPFLVLGALMLGMVLYVVYGVIGALQVLQGRPFRYVVIGRAVERYLEAPAA